MNNPIPESDYAPTPNDIHWAQNLMGLLKVGGTWETTYCTYRKKDEKTLEAIIFNTLEHNWLRKVMRDQKVFRAAGFEIEYGHTKPTENE